MKNTKLVIVLFLLAIFVNTGLSIISPLMGIIRNNLGASLISMALIFGLFPITRGILSPLCGKLTDKFSMKYLLITGFVIYIIMSFMYIIADNVGSLTLVRIIQGASAALILPVLFTFAGILSEENGTSTPTNLIMTAVTLGTAFGPLIGGVVYDFSGYNSVFIAMVIIELIGLLLVMFFVPAHRSSEKKLERPDEKNMSFKEKLKYHSAIITLLYTFITVFMMTIPLSFLSIYITDRKLNISTSDLGTILFIMVFIAGILTIPMSKLSDYHFKKKKFQNLYLLIIGGIVETVPFFFFPSVETFTGILTLSVFIGIGAGMMTPTVGTLAIFISKSGGSGFWWGIIALTTSLGYFLGSIVSCSLALILSGNNVFYACGIIGLILISFGIYETSQRLKGRILRN